jgi:hypothetical protein
LDGARAALTGYLYQFLGVCALRGRVTESGSDFITAILPGAKIERVHHELYSDALVHLGQSSSSGGETVAIQFKYSADGTPVSSNDLIEIIHGLEQSRQAAGNQTVTRYLLVTNRPLHESAKALLAKNKQVQRPKELLLVKRGGRPLAQWKRTILKSYPNAADAADKWWAVLKALDCRPGVAFAAGHDALRSYASAHGLSPHEHDTAIANLVGQLFVFTSQGAFEVSEEWLKTHLLGYEKVTFPNFGGDEVNGVDSDQGVHRWLVPEQRTRRSSSSPP